MPGGLRVVTEYLPGVRSASVGVWVGVGSRDEGASVAGAAHFLEHLLFKSTPTRTAVDIAQAMDAVGGELNAFTAKEHTCYYAHVLDGDLALAVDLVSDVVLNGRCAANDVELEPISALLRPIGPLAVPRVKAGVARNLGTLKELLESTRPAAQVGP